MNTTATKGIWSQELRPGLSVIVDTNRNQIIKRKNGKAKIFQFPSEPTIRMIDVMVKTISICEGITNDLESAIKKYNDKRGIQVNDTRAIFLDEAY